MTERAGGASVHLGLLLFPQYTSWAELREHALLADELGYDSLWTWDHFMPIAGADPEGPLYEGWQLLAGWGAITRRIRVGTLVTGVTYRHPAVVAKMVATLDHITGGRAICGLGAAWNQREHDMYGIPFDNWTVRFQKLTEACEVIRSLLDNPRTSFSGTHYRLADAVAEPKPVQRHLPLLIGGGGERKTLRITARWADMWHAFGTPQEMAHKLEVLRRHCAEAGRDPSEILPLCGIAPGVVIRDDGAGVERRLREIARRMRMQPQPGPRLRTVEEVAQRMAEYWRVGIRGFILGMAPPFDRETIERVAREVRPRFLELVS